MVETQYLSRMDVEVRAFGRRAYARLERDHDLPFVHGGYLRLGRTDADVARFENSLRLQGACGITDAAMLTTAEIAERWPHLITDDLSAGLFGSWDGYVDGYEVSQLLSRLVRQAGGYVQSKTRVTDAVYNGSWDLTTSNGRLEADVVVNAAGGWGSAVAEMLRAPVGLMPQLHGAVTIELPEERPFTPFVMDYVPGRGAEGVYFRSERKDQLIAGLHTEEVLHGAVSPDIQLGKMDFSTIERIATLLSERLNIVDDIRIGRSWTGIYPMSPDHTPIVGPHSANPTVICALGAGGNGIQLAPAIARMAADAILMRPTTFSSDLDWSHLRFADSTP
jgi:sarcosine oxidase subunit beta